MKFLDLFAGIGGFRMGMERAGHKCVGYVEIDKFARQSYQAIYNTKGEWTAHDITQVTNEEWGRFKGEVNCICGGFPCQSFSIAGKRKGFADETRGTLFFEIARAAKEIKPSYLFLENVKGLLNHDRGNTFRTILRTLDELGYDVEWQLCNSKNFGVPQNRERVIIIGHLRGASTREVFFDAGQDGQTTSTNEINDLLPVSAPRHGRRGTVLGTDGISSALAATDYKLPKQIAVNQIGNISDSSSFGGNPQTGRVYDPEGLSPTLNTMQGGGREPKIIDDQGRKNKKVIPTDVSPTLRAQSHGNEPKVVIPALNPDMIKSVKNSSSSQKPEVLIGKYERTKFGKAIRKKYENGEVNLHRSQVRKLKFKVSKLSNTITTVQKDNLIAIPVLTPDRINKRQNGRRFKTEGEPMFTLDVADRHGVLFEDDTDNLRIRKLTPRECWRLQGFPDWAFDKAKDAGVSNSQLYKQAGNSVTVPLMEFVAKRL